MPDIKEHSFRCGYAPRSIRYSLNSETLFVGCKDGTITIVTNLASPEMTDVQGYRTSGLSERGKPRPTARALIEWQPGWLLIGRDDGSIDLMHWESVTDETGSEPEMITIYPTPAGHRRERVTSLEWLDPSRLLVSFRNGATRVVTWEPGTSAADSARRSFAAAWADPAAELRGVKQLIGASRMTSSCGNHPMWLLIAQSGKIWKGEDQGGRLVAQEERFWPMGEAPGFVSDYVLVKPRYNKELRERKDFEIRAQRGDGTYMATDNGVYFLRWQEGRLVPLRMSLPGLGRIAISLTYYADAESGYLWVSDAAGDAHLFWDELDEWHPRFPNWRRSALRHDASQVILGSASWRTLAGGFIISQARRNDHVEIRRYQFDPSWKQERRIPAAVGASEWHRLLQKGTVEMEEIRARVGRGGETQAGDWDSDALLAELFDLLGDDSEALKGLSEFLGNPTPDLARRFLQDLKEEDPERSGRAVKAWTYALLGAIHHSRQSDKESLYRGLIRWLRAIAETKLDSPEQTEEVRAAAEDQILFVRKWGIFGSSYAQRKNAADPLQILLQQGKEDRRLDRYAYQSLLFHRHADLEFEDDRARMAGRTAWDLKALDIGGRLLVAVSWIRGGVHLHEMVGRSPAEGGGYRLDRYAVLETCSQEDVHLEAKNLEPGEAWEERGGGDFGYNRALVLGRLPGEDVGWYLLACPAQRHDAQIHDRAEIWRLDVSGQRVRVAVEGEAEVAEVLPIVAEESVYSLLELEPGLVLAGLRGYGGAAQVLLLKIEVQQGKLALRCFKPFKLQAAVPVGRAITRNSVWSLALEERGAARDHHLVFAGCEDGQIWQLKVPRAANLGEDFNPDTTPVERLGAPVWALACRGEMRRDTLIRRVFAGGADGTILALQELSNKPGAFTTVWATREEEGSIARLHLLGRREEYDSDKDHDEYPMVLAVTQQGRCIFFSDIWEVETSRGDSTKHQRLRFPGERHGRPRLHAPAFASDLFVMPEGLIPRRVKEGFGRLLTATNDGRLRVHTLHVPLYLKRRRSEYVDLVHLWLKMASEIRGGASVFKPHSLRLVEAAYVASPVAPSVLVRALLASRDSAPWEDAPSRDTLERQWLPHFVRPLLDLHHAWDSFPDAGAIKKARSALDLALERAWRRQDRDLFVEIVSVVLQRSNFWLFEVAGREPDKAEAAQIEKFYGGLLEALEKSMKRWLGFPDRAELLTRMSFAKQLTDGDTLWRLGTFNLGTILSARIGIIRNLLVLGDPLLALETLRATNVALLRVAKRLVDDGGRGAGWEPDAPRHELKWKSLDSYARTLADLAVTAFQLTRRVSDALAHEIARSFALLVCVCPSASIRVVQWMAEADLVSPETPKEDRTQSVLSQLELLADLGAPVPKVAIDLFVWASSTSPGTLEPELAPSKIGWSNWQVIEAGEPFRAILGWLSRLAAQLSSDASGIDLGEARELNARLENVAKEDPFRHSRDFWKKALGEFETAILQKKQTPSDRIKPEIVLLSRRIVGWCMAALKELEKRTQEHEMFEPQHTMYRRALENLGRAASEFPNSAAVQKNIVLGILGHGLLEALDEHVLELEEIAQALDPLLVWDHRRVGRVSNPRRSSTRAEYFARYLLARSRDAESIPKNLRTLRGLLWQESAESSGTYSLVKDLLSDFRPDGQKKPDRRNPGWFLPEEDEKREIPLSPQELRFLRMTLKELDQNDRLYGPPLEKRSALEHHPSLKISPDGRKLSLVFPLLIEADNVKRLKMLQGKELQTLFPRREARDVASHGTGLYLANLAAAVVRWRLSIQDINEEEKWFSFLLEQAETDEVAR